jgi:hypothetical protein
LSTRGVAVPKKYTTQQIIKRFQQVHGTRYDYTNVVYNNMHEKVEIICLIHGSFYMRPNDHLNNHGCTSCGGIQANKKIIQMQKETLIQEKTLFDLKYEKIHATRRINNNYKSARLKGIQTLKETGKYYQWRENWYRSMVECGHFHNPQILSIFKKYKRKVYRETQKTLLQYGSLIEYHPLVFAKEEKVVDHRYSVKEGFINEVPITIMAHICNLSILSQHDNAVKSCKCSITIEQLITDIEYFNQFGAFR